jgi:t-SNARE complex subunit (syntaxin)
LRIHRILDLNIKKPESVSATQQNVSTAQQNVSTAQQNVSTAQQNVSTTQQNVSTAQQFWRVCCITRIILDFKFEMIFRKTFKM